MDNTLGRAISPTAHITVTETQIKRALGRPRHKRKHISDRGGDKK